MKRWFSRLSVCLLLAVPTLAAAQTVLVDEDFESYASTSELNAVWAAVGANGTLIDETYVTVIDSTTFEDYNLGARAFNPNDDGSTGRGVEHIGGGVVELNLAALNGGSPLFPTATQSIVVEGDIFDVGALGNKRMSIGLRSTAPENLIELGQWNTPADTAYAARGILFPTSGDDPANPNWFFFTADPALDGDDTEEEGEAPTVGPEDIGEAWTRYRAIITPDTVTFELDFYRDGLNNATDQAGVDASETFTLRTGANGYNSLRIGAPSGVSSAGINGYGGVVFDNLYLALIDVEAPLVGDYNGDGFVDAADYTVYRDSLGDSVTAGEGADGNGNGVIDTGDYDLWVENYGGGSSTAAAVPEPAGLVLLACGVAAAAVRRRR